jgi:hypothetical protein
MCSKSQVDHVSEVHETFKLLMNDYAWRIFATGEIDNDAGRRLAEFASGALRAKRSKRANFLFLILETIFARSADMTFQAYPPGGIRFILIANTHLLKFVVPVQ